MRRILNFALMYRIDFETMFGGSILKAWQRFVAITIVTAILVMSFHLTSFSSDALSTGSELHLSQTEPHSHDKKGTTSLAEEHSHPHGVLPTVLSVVVSTEGTAWSFTNQPGLQGQYSNLERPPRAIAL